MNLIKSFSILLAGALVLSSCGLFSTPNPQATVDSAVASTISANAALESTVQVAVQSTLAVIPTLTPQPESTPSLELLSYSEEQLASQSVDSIDQVYLTLSECLTTTQEAAAKGTLTESDLNSLTGAVESVNNDLEKAQALLTAYIQVFGDLSASYISELQSLQAEIEPLLRSVYAVDVILQQFDALLQQGQVLTPLNIQQVDVVLQAAIARTVQAQGAFQSYQRGLAEKIAARQQAILQVPPDETPLDLPTTIQKGFAYLDAVKAAVADKKITLAELEHIAALGASFSQGVDKFGGPALQSLAEQASGPDSITASLAAGRINQAKAGLGSFEAGLGPRP